jgi:protein-S-isoprenylcysteine O-methyltransferase Ste14
MTVGVAIGVLWAGFMGYRLVSALRTKRSAGGQWWRGAVLGVLMALGLARTLQLLIARHALAHAAGFHPPRLIPGLGPAGASLGLAICALGIGLAVWARIHLGRNWGAPMSLREGHELVTTGPYALVRHPIYTGILVGMAGTALALGWPWLVLLVVFCLYFLYAAKMEERTMVAQFPNTYPAYKSRTKMLIPFVL